MSTIAKLKQMLLFLNLLCPSVNVMDVICVLLRYLDILLDLLFVVIVGHRMGQQLGEH